MSKEVSDAHPQFQESPTQAVTDVSLLPVVTVVLYLLPSAISPGLTALSSSAWFNVHLLGQTWRAGIGKVQVHFFLFLKVNQLIKFL